MTRAHRELSLFQSMALLFIEGNEYCDITGRSRQSSKMLFC